MYIYIHIAFPHFRVYVCMVSDMFCIHSFAYMYLRFQTHSPNSPPSLALQMPRHVRLQCVKNVDLDRDIRLLCVHWSRLEMCVCVRVCVCVCVCVYVVWETWGHHSHRPSHTHCSTSIHILQMVVCQIWSVLAYVTVRARNKVNRVKAIK